MKFLIKYLRKIVVFVIGVAIFVIGVILIPLPGPGILICFVGLFILSLEFDWVKPHLDRVKKELQKVIDTSRARSDKINRKANKPK